MTRLIFLSFAFQIVSCGKGAHDDASPLTYLDLVQEEGELKSDDLIKYLKTGTKLSHFAAGLSSAAGIDSELTPKDFLEKMRVGVAAYEKKLEVALPQMVGKELLFSCQNSEPALAANIVLVAVDAHDSADDKKRKFLVEKAKQDKIIVAFEGLSNAIEPVGHVKSDDGFEFMIEKGDNIYGLENHHVHVAELLVSQLKLSYFQRVHNKKKRTIEEVVFHRAAMLDSIAAGGICTKPIERVIRNGNLNLSNGAKDFLLTMTKSTDSKKTISEEKTKILDEIFNMDDVNWEILVMALAKEHLLERFGALTAVDEIVSAGLLEKRISIHDFAHFYFSNLEIGNIDRVLTLSNLYCKAIKEKKGLFIAANSSRIPGIFNYVSKSKLDAKKIHLVATQKHLHNVQEELNLLQILSKNSKPN